MSDIIKGLIEFREWCKENNLDPNDDKSFKAYMDKDKVSVDKITKSFIEKAKTNKLDGMIIIGFKRNDEDNVDIAISIDGMINKRAVLSAFSKIYACLLERDNKDKEEQ